MPPAPHLSPAQLLAHLPAGLRPLLARAAASAGRSGARLWLVGGVVRDLLLGLGPGRDLDLAVEGDAPELARALAEELGGRVVAAHAAFGTATLELPRPESGPPLLLDLAGTRAERYPRPGALPEVAPAPIEADLGRRDFSLNALALELRAEGPELRAGRLLDPFDGRGDLAAGRLRLLHPASLHDDPTRLLRGLRLAARLGLRPEPWSAGLIEEARAGGYLGLLTAERVLGELCLALEEPRPDEALRVADGWGLTPQLLPGLAWGEALAARGARLAAAAPAPPLLWAGLLLYELDGPALAAIAARYPLPAEAAALLRQLAPLRALAPELTAGLANSALDRRLRPFGTLAISVLHYADPSAAAAAARYLGELRPARPPLDGNDLRRLGVPPGPRLGRLLEELRAAALDGLIPSRQAAEAWVAHQLQDGPG